MKSIEPRVGGNYQFTHNMGTEAEFFISVPKNHLEAPRLFSEAKAAIMKEFNCDESVFRPTGIENDDRILCDLTGHVQ